jgi:hypothetical protein
VKFEQKNSAEGLTQHLQIELDVLGIGLERLADHLPRLLRVVQVQPQVPGILNTILYPPDPYVFGPPDPDPLVRGTDPDPLVRGTNPDPSIIKKTLIPDVL